MPNVESFLIKVLWSPKFYKADWNFTRHFCVIIRAGFVKFMGKALFLLMFIFLGGARGVLWSHKCSNSFRDPPSLTFPLRLKLIHKELIATKLHHNVTPPGLRSFCQGQGKCHFLILSCTESNHSQSWMLGGFFPQLCNLLRRYKTVLTAVSLGAFKSGSFKSFVFYRQRTE